MNVTNTMMKATRLAGAVETQPNAGNAKSVKVKIVANSGGRIEYPFIGFELGHPGCDWIVWDFSTMQSKPKIPLDYSHQDNSIGYLNRIETVDGQLVLCHV